MAWRAKKAVAYAMYVDVVGTLMIRVREVLGLNLGWHSGLQENVGIVRRLGHDRFLNKVSSNNSSTISYPVDAI
jgi:hypothetical protein